MKPQSITKQHEALGTAYDNAVQALADRVRTELVIPFCERKAMRFTAGMGTWGFDRGAWLDRYHSEVCLGSWAWETTAEAERLLGVKLYQALTLEVHKGQDLGSVISDYTPTTYKAS